jgi:hypothetical protein
MLRVLGGTTSNFPSVVGSLEIQSCLKWESRHIRWTLLRGRRILFNHVLRSGIEEFARGVSQVRATRLAVFFPDWHIALSKVLRRVASPTRPHNSFVRLLDFGNPVRHGLLDSEALESAECANAGVPNPAGHGGDVLELAPRFANAGVRCFAFHGDVLLSVHLLGVTRGHSFTETGKDGSQEIGLKEQRMRIEGGGNYTQCALKPRAFISRKRMNDSQSFGRPIAQVNRPTPRGQRLERGRQST